MGGGDTAQDGVSGFQQQQGNEKEFGFLLQLAQCNYYNTFGCSVTACSLFFYAFAAGMLYCTYSLEHYSYRLEHGIYWPSIAPHILGTSRRPIFTTANTRKEFLVFSTVLFTYCSTTVQRSRERHF